MRTPDGMLWAGSTFSLRAIATTHDGRLSSVSNQATVRVGEVIRWRLFAEGESAQTVQGSEGWFTLLLQNRGNTIDALNLRIKVNESADASPWIITQFEQRADGSAFSNGSLLSDATSPFMPGESRRLYLRVRPPGDRNTDGAWIDWLGVSQRNASTTLSRDFAVGMETAIAHHTAASPPPNYRIVGNPVLVAGRLYWLTWDGMLLRLYRTPNPLSVNTTFSNNTSFEARISMPEPTSQTVLIGDRWYLRTQSGQIGFFLLSQAQGGTTLSAQFINLPGGVVPAPHLPLVNCAGNLCFVDTQNRVWQFNSATGVFTLLVSFSSRPITAFSALDTNLLAVGRDDGRIDIYYEAAPVVQNFRAPTAGNQPVRFLRLHQGLLLLAVGNTLAIYHIDTAKWLWAHTLDSAIIAPPVLDMRHKGACYALTESGWLYGFALPRGEILPLYPRRMFDSWVARAALSCRARADREIPYLYLQAELADGTVRTMLITAHNPLNRFIHSTNLISTPIGGQWLFTGNTDQDLAIQWVSWGTGSEANRGMFYAFRLR
ncbi:MAG: hypothetical protein KatS3mg018_1973 [Fimbriimonadales bacterium]|nr:MAG: hypothetical protein KatS3mg018_1973 [Fimbriimonadales bacterium]